MHASQDAECCVTRLGYIYKIYYSIYYANFPLQFSTSWGYFLLFHMNFSIFIHTVSIWLTLSLAIWRFIMIKFPAMSVSLCTVEKCKVVLGLGYGNWNLGTFKRVKLVLKCIYSNVALICASVTSVTLVLPYWLPHFRKTGFFVLDKIIETLLFPR